MIKRYISILLSIVLFALPALAQKHISVPVTELQKTARYIDHLIKRDSINELIIQQLKDSIQHLSSVKTIASVDTASRNKIPSEAFTLKDRGGITESTSLWLFMLIAFGAGLLSVITPCVFPMVPMTVSFFTNSSSSRKQAIRKAFIYGLSIVFIYTLIGVAIARFNGPEFADFLSTHWAPNLLFTIVFIIFALSFFGLFEITLPNSFINKIDQQSDKGGYIGLFFMAFTIVLVSFSCTGPIVSTILLSAAGGEIIKPIVGMAAYSSAFALPFTLFALFPNWLKSLPKSGGWLNTVKISLGFIELALAMKFLSTADQVEHWELLSRNVFLIIWIVVFLALALYLFGIIKFSQHDKGSVGALRKGIAAVVLLFVIYLSSGLFGFTSLKEISGYIPPAKYVSTGIDKLCTVPKYKELMHLPLSLQGYFDYKEALACAKKQGKPLFIDFTGHGCSNCREVENYVWADPFVHKKLDQDFIIVALYVDERTILPEASWYTSTLDKKVKKSIGQQNKDFQRARFNFNGQPFYVIIDPATEKELVQPIAYEKDVDAFVDFLDEGKENYRKLNK